jgi:lipoyl synthase
MKSERLPSWLLKTLPASKDFSITRSTLRANKINTVCEQARCPNIYECFAKKAVTFIILGQRCTRRCRYCSVSKQAPEPVDTEEPIRIARTVKELSLTSVVITSVTRDDLPDFGAGQFASTIREIKRICPETEIEVLVPDFKGDTASLQTVLDSKPDIFGHNLETVNALFEQVRPLSSYETSIEILREAHARGSVVKSGIMVGLGETETEIVDTFKELKSSGVQILTIGQYLKPDPECLPVAKYYTPEEFASLNEKAQSIGFETVISGPFVRSSYRFAS